MVMECVDDEKWTMLFDGASNALGHAKVLEVDENLALVIHLLKGEWEIRESKLIPYHSYIKGLIEQFDEITFHHIPHDDNQLADTKGKMCY
ncbi:hypothetical protein CR513_19493, partial [Mucuna pruriens]